MSIDLYCGRCHRWLDDRSPAERGDNVCHCLNSDLSKNPNCRNNLHEHHDPQSPIVKSMKTIRRAEDIADGFIKVGEGECTCGLDAYKAPEQHSPACPVWAAAFEETRDELDAILRETNEKVED